jgi:molecular chaperone GrpE (heat shock protein)
MNTELSKIESEITKIKQENLKQKNDIEELSLNHERQIDALINDFIQVIDAYEKVEAKITESGLADDENAAKAIKRMQQPKRVALSVLSKYNVNQIDLDGKMIDENLCTVVDTEPDSSKEDGMVVSIEKNGYVRGERLIRRAEVIIIKN